MRIIEVNKFFHERRGAERHFLDLIALLRSRGHEVAVFSMDHPKNAGTPFRKYFVSRVGYNRDDSALRQRIVGVGRLFWSFEARRNMKKLLDDFHPDLVHIHNAYHQLSLSFLPIVRKRGIPIVMTVHDYHIVSPDKDAYHGTVGRSYWRFLFVRKYGFGKRFLLVLKSYWERMFGFGDMIDRFLVPSRFVKEALVRGGIPEGKIAVIPHFAVSSDPKEMPNSAPSEGEPYALYFGGIVEEKGIRELADVFGRLRFPLVLAGVKTMDVPEGGYVRYVGEKTPEELSSLISGASFVVSASRLPETFGLIALEANMQGKAFYGYRTGAFPEIVENGRNGRLAANEDEFGDMIARAINGDDGLASSEEIRSEARRTFGAETYLRRLEKLVRSVSAVDLSDA